jgi:hypothetical protein
MNQSSPSAELRNGAPAHAGITPIKGLLVLAAIVVLTAAYRPAVHATRGGQVARCPSCCTHATAFWYSLTASIQFSLATRPI